MSACYECDAIAGDSCPDCGAPLCGYCCNETEHPACDFDWDKPDEPDRDDADDGAVCGVHYDGR